MLVRFRLETKISNENSIEYIETLNDQVDQSQSDNGIDQEINTHPIMVKMENPTELHNDVVNEGKFLINCIHILN